MRRASIAAAAVLAVLAAAVPAHAVVPLAATYDARITGTVSEWNAVLPGYQVTGAVDLPALVFVEPRRSAPRPDAPVIGIFTGRTPALDTRPGAIAFGTNSQAFHVDPNVLGPTQAAIDVALVQANVAAGTVTATVDEGPARTITVSLFRTSASFFSAPAQILAGTIALQFGADGRTFTGSLDLGGNGLIEPGNPLFRVRRYTATVAGTATALTLPPGGGGGGGGARDEGSIELRRLAAPRGGLVAARRRGIAIEVDCPAACGAQASLLVSRATARRAGLAGRTVGSTDASREAAGALDLAVRLTRGARRRLAALDGAFAVTARVRVESGEHRRTFRRRFAFGG